MHPKKHSQRAYEVIKAGIVHGRYQGYINGRRTAKELEIGFTPVREAFIILENEGLVSRMRNSGYFVNRVELRDLIQLFQTRECVESYALGQMVGCMSEADLRHMREINCQYGEALEQAVEMPQLHCLNVAFHMVPILCCRNPDLTKLYKNACQKLLLCPEYVLHGSDRATIAEHEDYWNAISAGEKKEAQSILRTHLHNTRKRIRMHYVSALE